MRKVSINSWLVMPIFLSGTLMMAIAASAAEVQVKLEETQQTALEIQEITPATPTAIKQTQASQFTDNETAIPLQTEPLTNEIALPTPAANVQEEEVSSPMAQVTSVSQLSDVQPSDWAFQALQSLVERYGCIAGYPDRSYRGNRAMTRYEFATGLNACLNRVQQLIAASTENAVTREDLATLQNLQEKFPGELAALRGRVDVLEARTTQLEAHPFSTTTKLNGEVIFGIVSVLNGDKADGTPAEKKPTLSDRVRLNFDTSFTGKDRLRTRLQANNVISLNQVLKTFEGRVNFDGSSNNDVLLSLLTYRFPLSSKTTAYVGTTGGGPVDYDFATPLNPIFDGGNSISTFGLRNPIYNYVTGAGAGVRHKFNQVVEFDASYVAGNAASPSNANGLFDGKYSALAQLVISPSKSFTFALTYNNTYSPASRPFGSGAGSILANSNFKTAVLANGYGFEGVYRFNPNFIVSGWVGYLNQRYIGKGDANVLTWAATLAFPDLGKKGNLAGFLIGMEPKVIDISDNLNRGQADRDTSLHIDAFYKYQLTDNISITPGLIWVTAPNHDEKNNDVVIGTIRTIFRF